MASFRNMSIDEVATRINQVVSLNLTTPTNVGQQDIPGPPRLVRCNAMRLSLDDGTEEDHPIESLNIEPLELNTVVRALDFDDLSDDEEDEEMEDSDDETWVPSDEERDPINTETHSEVQNKTVLCEQQDGSETELDEDSETWCSDSDDDSEFGTLSTISYNDDFTDSEDEEINCAYEP